ncbi:Uncharacterised protein [Vibrio cholerae]|nr:Uncharacterised protein [Vibrio cholerae]
MKADQSPPLGVLLGNPNHLNAHGGFLPTHTPQIGQTPFARYNENRSNGVEYKDTRSH